MTDTKLPANIEAAIDRFEEAVACNEVGEEYEARIALRSAIASAIKGPESGDEETFVGPYLKKKIWRERDALRTECNLLQAKLAEVSAERDEANEQHQDIRRHYTNLRLPKPCAGCGGSVLLEDQYRCADCERVYHQACLKAHCAQDRVEWEAHRTDLQFRLAALDKQCEGYKELLNWLPITTDELIRLRNANKITFDKQVNAITTCLIQLRALASQRAEGRSHERVQC